VETTTSAAERTEGPGTASSADGRLEALAKQYAGLIVAVAARVGGALTEAYRDDIRQNVLIALWKRLERADPIERPSSYIFKAAVRETARTVRRELERRQRGEALELVAEPASDQDSPHRQLDGREHAGVIRDCLAELDVDRRRAVQAHLAGFDVDEIMQNYGWSYQKARNLVARGMSDLRLALARKGVHGH
jgi:RNA polymerase sigma factor (sigma-70 family)